MYCVVAGRREITHNHVVHRIVINHIPKSACNVTGTEELLEDGTQIPKHVGATE
jgi:hypothetical protein